MHRDGVGAGEQEEHEEQGVGHPEGLEHEGLGC